MPSARIHGTVSSFCSGSWSNVQRVFRACGLQHETESRFYLLIPFQNPESHEPREGTATCTVRWSTRPSDSVRSSHDRPSSSSSSRWRSQWQLSMHIRQISRPCLHALLSTVARLLLILRSVASMTMQTDAEILDEQQVRRFVDGTKESVDDVTKCHNALDSLQERLQRHLCQDDHVCLRGKNFQHRWKLFPSSLGVVLCRSLCMLCCEICIHARSFYYVWSC